MTLQADLADVAPHDIQRAMSIVKRIVDASVASNIDVDRNIGTDKMLSSAVRVESMSRGQQESAPPYGCATDVGVRECALASVTALGARPTMVRHIDVVVASPRRGRDCVVGIETWLDGGADSAADIVASEHRDAGARHD